MKKSVLLALALVGAVQCAGAAVVSGKVVDSDGRGVARVAVSDGKGITLTDDGGNYSLDTDKSCGYVFMVTPDGYEPAQSYVNRPKFWQLLTAPADKDERADFKLKRTPDSRLAVITLADIQMGRITNDVSVFHAKTVPAVNATIDSLRRLGMEPVALTLGDESWDNYWHRTGYALPEAAADQEAIDCMVYNVIGNHDHNPRVLGDEHASDTWRRIMGPNYYAFNRGGVHIVALDDIYYLNEGATEAQNGKRNYKNHLTDEQLAWLRKDLALVPDTVPVIVAMHAPLFRDNGKYAMDNGADLVAELERFHTVKVLTGHTHRSYAMANEAGNIRENNYGAVCGTWWRTDQPDFGNNSVCVDGTPSGYAIWTNNGGKLRGQYKGTEHEADYQFRVYDMNTLADKEKNGILINVWGWAPGWKIEVMEKERPLKVERMRSQDPFFIESCQKPQISKGIKPTKASMSPNMFMAKARKAKTPVTVKVTDADGRVYTQTVERPRTVTTVMK
ncbi:MAG: calcineurin-like phosphoesterase family protein [Muribaculaceae bacterium]|nr:calcineurin-like phosphoesterase family protein [Muribaculaceae bacterium]